MSVLHLNTARTWRGGEQQVLYLARYLKESGIRQLVLGQPDSAMQERCIEAGIPFRPLRMRAEIDVIAARQIALYARDFRVVHAHTARAHGLGLLAMHIGGLERLGVRFVVSRRVDFPAARNFWSRQKYLSPLVHRYIAISENVRRILIADGIASGRISVAYSGIDTARFRKLPDTKGLQDEFSLPSKAVIFGNVAALVEHKDQRTLLKAAALLKERIVAAGIRTPWRLFVVGDGELGGSLRQMRSDLGLEQHVIFTGFRNDVPRFLSLFDVFVMSSREEGLGTAVLDAMACGLPIISTSGGGLPEMVVPDRGGWLSAVGDAAGLAGNMLRILKDSDRRKRFGAFNRKRVEQFSFRETGRRNLEIYREVLRA